MKLNLKGHHDRKVILGGGVLSNRSVLKYHNGTEETRRRTFVHKKDDSIIKNIQIVSDENEPYDINSYKEFQKNNLNFVEIERFEKNSDGYTFQMKYIPGISLWEYSCINSRDKTWNICINYYWKFVKAMIDFSETKMNNSKIFFHCDLNSHNIIINDHVPYVIDPDSFGWASKEYFVRRIQENINNFFDEDLPGFEESGHRKILSLNLFGKI